MSHYCPFKSLPFLSYPKQVVKVILTTGCIAVPSAPIVHSPNGNSIGSAVLAQLTAESPYTYNGLFFPPELPLPMRGSGPHLLHHSLGPPKSSTQTASQSVQLFLQDAVTDRLTDRQTDRQSTDRATRSVTIDRIYVCSMCDAA